MITSKLVSVVVNCFNGQSYLKEALQSVIDQDYKNWELIFWDNMSTDLSKNIFQEFKDPRFKYFYSKKHTLLYAARNLALEKCGGEYIAFLDVDDYWEPNKLSMQLKKFEDGIALVYTNFWILNEYKKTKKIIFFNRTTTPLNICSIVANYSICMSSIMIKKSTIVKTGIKFDSRYQIIGDFKMVLDLLKSFNIAYVKKPLVTYRWHGKNTSFIQKACHLKELKQLESECRDEIFIKELGEKIAYLEATELLMTGRRFYSLKKIYMIKSYWKKMKIIVGFLSPIWFIKKIRV